jgi:hypothetical protein
MEKLDQSGEFFASSDNLRYLEIWNFGVSNLT